MSKSSSNSSGVEKDCTFLCQSIIHGCIITSCMTKRAVSDRQVASYLNILCENFGQVKDDVGRTALHMAGSCGRLELCHWLLKHVNSDINARDRESQSTPLHRSLFYGQIHVSVLLMKAGANIFATDVDNLSCLDYAMKDMIPLNYSLQMASEVYIWGSNSNYTHGSGNQQSRQLPELVDTFRKNNVSIKQVCLNKFHSVFVGSDGRAWACGHGMGGRLGIDSESTVLIPQLIKTGSELVKAVSIGRDHTVLLMDNGSVLTCGLNNHHQLGIVPPPKQLLIPRAIFLSKLTKGVAVEGILASRFHSLFWTKDSIFTFGLHAGQLGHPATHESTIISPRLVTSLNHNITIKQVATSDGAIVISVAKGDIYVLHEYQTRKIASKIVNVAKIAVSGGHLNAKADNKTLMDQGGEDLQIIVLTTIGKLFIWFESVPQLTRCNYNIHRSLDITDVCLTHQHILLATKDGEGFLGEVILKSKKKLINCYGVSKSQNNEKDDFLSIRLHRLPNLHRTISITSDPKGRNFAAIQVHPKVGLTELPKVGSSDLVRDLATLLMEASEEDSLHDIVFEVGYERFAAHRYILRLNSELDIPFYNDEVKDGGIPIVKIENIHPRVFQQLLQFVYTGDCDIIHPGPCNIRLPLQNKTDPIRMALEYAKKFKICNLVKILQKLKFDSSSGMIMGSLIPVTLPPVLNYLSHTDLYDVQIMSSDGITIKAHKCVLAARLEYFHSMLAGGWIETSATKSLKLQIPISVLSDVIEFIYNDTVAKLQTLEDFEHICSLLIVADQMFMIHLKELCEVTLSNALSLRNASHLMQFAATYNADQLKRCCMQYILLNLPAILEGRTLEVVSAEVLKELSNYYKDITPIMSHRVITPFTCAPSDEEILSAFEMHPLLWEVLGDSELDDFELLSNRITPLKQGKNLSFSSTSSASGKKKRSHRMSNNEVQRKRYESVSSNSDLEITVSSLSIDDVHEQSDEWITVDKTQKSVQARLKVLVKAATIQPNPEDYIQLPVPRAPSSSAVNINNKISSTNAIMASSPPPPSLDNTSQFPMLSNQVHSKAVTSTSPRSNVEVKRIPSTKLSQKQRKKLAADVINVKEVQSTTSPSITAVSAWGVIPPLNNESEFSIKSFSKDSKTKNSSHVEFASSSPKSVPSLSDIVADERKQKDNWSRMRTKSFHLTQVEDQAMEGLLIFYNAANVHDERITVQRVPRGNVAKPIWIASKR